MTVKSDYNEEKRQLASDIIRTGDYQMREATTNSGKTKQIVDIMLNFLKD